MRVTQISSLVSYEPCAGFYFSRFCHCRATDSQGANESHEDLTSVLYNNTFNQVVMVKSLGLVKVYQAEVSESLIFCEFACMYQ